MRTRSRFILVISALLILTIGASFVQAQDMVIKIASQSPLSGGQSVLGTGLRNGTELAIEQLGGNLRDMGFDLQYVPFDDQATPDVGVANAQQIVADPAILALIGHFNSGVAIPSSEVYDANNLVMVSPANTNPTVTDRGLATVNRVVGRDDLQGPTGAQFAASLEGVSSVYILHDTTAYGQGVAEFFRQEAERQGLTVLGFEGTEERANFDGILQPILAQAPDVIYMGGIYDQFGILAAQARAAGFAGQFMGPDGMDSPDYAELAGDAAVGTYYTSVAGPASLYPNAAQFIEDYTAAYGEPPTPFAAQAYDATGIALAAIERAIAANDGAVPTREAVAAEVRATENYEGITGTITFDDNGDPETSNYYVLQVSSADPAEWNNNAVISTIEIPSPLHAAEMEGMEATPEATAEM
jgi:branched-chain amino acid transport system substrate-binding protein